MAYVVSMQTIFYYSGGAEEGGSNNMKVYPLGTEQDPSGTHLRSLMQSPSMCAIDCRLNPWHPLPVWQKPTLVAQYRNRYRSAGAFLGNAAHPSNQMFPGKCEIALVDPERGISGLMGYLLEGYDLVLIDHYLELKYSHLTEVIRLLQAAMPAVLVMLRESRSAYKFAVRAKVYVELGGKKIAAIVLESHFADGANYDWCRLRVACYSELARKWLVSEYPRPVQSYKLTKRPTIIPELDEEEYHGKSQTVSRTETNS